MPVGGKDELAGGELTRGRQAPKQKPKFRFALSSPMVGADQTKTVAAVYT